MILHTNPLPNFTMNLGSNLVWVAQLLCNIGMKLFITYVGEFTSQSYLHQWGYLSLFFFLIEKYIYIYLLVYLTCGA